jgi:nitroreductase
MKWNGFSWKEGTMDMLPELIGRRARRAISGEALDPSCFNTQPWRIIAAEKREGSACYNAIAEALTPGNAWALEAPLLLVFTTGPHLDCRMDGGRDYAFFDLGQAALALQLQAHREGLYAHPMAGFSPAKMKTVLGIPPEVVPLCVIAVGKPGDPERLAEGPRKSEDSPRNRKPLGDVIFRDSYDSAWE